MEDEDRTLIVTCARDVAGVVMPTYEWETFKREVLKWAGETLTDVYFRGEGLGWSPKWGQEDAYTVMGTFRSWKNWSDCAVRLRDVRARYGQEAVAVSWVNEVEFV